MDHGSDDPARRAEREASAVEAAARAEQARVEAGAVADLARLGAISPADERAQIDAIRRKYGLPEEAAHSDEHGHAAGAHESAAGHGHEKKGPATKKDFAIAAGAASTIGLGGKVLKAGEAVVEYPVGKLEDKGEEHAPTWFKNGLDKVQDALANLFPSMKRREGGHAPKKKSGGGHGGHGGGGGHH